MSDHIVPLKVYYAVFAALMVLTVITVLVAFFDFGVLNDVVAMAIAGSKALLVILYFMHVRYGNRLTWIFASAGFVFLAILLAFTLSDYLSRGWQFQPDPAGIALLVLGAGC